MTGPSETRKPIDLFIASAGTGKTFRLVEKIQEAIDAGIDTKSILATTFTNKAAAELLERVRASLIREGQAVQAAGLLSARIGTVNATFGKIVGEFALHAGRSPVADVVSEERQGPLFAIAAEAAFRPIAGRIIPVARRLAIEHWEDDVKRLVDLVRQNDIDPADLGEHAERSWQGMREIFPAPEDQSGEELDQSLHRVLTQSKKALQASSDSTNKTAVVARTINKACATLDSGRHLPWQEWVRLAKLDPAKSSRLIVRPVIDIATRHPAHPGLHSDIQTYIEGVYAAAKAAIESYAEYKATNGLVDFIDQEHEALQLLDDPDVSEHLGETLSRVFVDEFQDTSPIQLALFLKVSQIAERSFWVGDTKQAIYGFRGTDPALTDRVAAEVVPRSGGESGTLSTSYRARPGLVEFTNRLYVPAFETLGFPARSVRIENCARRDADGQREPVEVWQIAGRNWDVATRSLAEGIRAVLDAPAKFAVYDRSLDGSRPIRGSDIAVLCRANNRCAEVAAALASAGIHASIARPGLLETPEAFLVVAALRFLVDPNDTLAIAEIAHLFDDTASKVDADAPAQPAWFARSVSDSGIRSLVDEVPVLKTLDAARAQLTNLTPREALEVAMTAAGIGDRVYSWGSALDRIANLDALRGLADQYEDEARTARGAATAAGLVAWLGGSGGADAELPPSTDPDAVNVLTYHRAKGLEWPMVVLLDLHSARERSAFGFSAETSGEFDVWAPLNNRWVRFWPWPYGSQKKRVFIDASVVETEEHETAAWRERTESVRLLYVGMTRARDYLVLATRELTKKGQQLAWLELLADEGGSVIDSSRLESDEILGIAGEALPVRQFEFDEDRIPPTKARTLTSRMPESAVKPVFQPYRISPSKVTPSADREAQLISRVRLGSRIPFNGSPDINLLGEAVHAFLAYDRHGQDEDERFERAVQTLARWDAGSIEPRHLVNMSERLFAHLAKRFPETKIRAEVPVFGRREGKRIGGRIDLLLTSDTKAVVIDHKTYPGRFETWERKALSHAPQLALYAAMVRSATGCAQVETWVHMPIVGQLLQVRAPDPLV